jgi:hypothetical protein
MLLLKGFLLAIALFVVVVLIKPQWLLQWLLPPGIGIDLPFKPGTVIALSNIGYWLLMALFVTVAVVLMASLTKDVRKLKAKAEASATSATLEGRHD